jgi:phage shock protein A
MTAETAGTAGKAMPWIIAFVLVGLAAIAAAAWASIEYKRANQLAAQLSTTKTQIDQLQGQTEQLQGQIGQLQGQIAQLQQQAGQAASRLQQSAKPDLPVTISFRQALLGSGMVATFKNFSASPLEVAAVFSSQATGQEQRRNLVLAPKGVNHWASARLAVRAWAARYAQQREL